jgi:TrmH family RNA methyltransferase
MAATSARDPRVVRAARLLRDEAARAEERAFVIDDPDLLHMAVAAGVEIEFVLGEWPGAAEASPDALRALAALGQPPRIVAVCRVPPPAPPDLPPRSLVLARVASAGNVGSIIRTAAAFRLPRVGLTTGCADPWSRPALRAAKGATFAPGLVATGATLDASRLAAAVPRGGAPPEELPREAAVVLGGEGEGLSEEELARCELRVTIPASGFESLNVAAAAAILAWHLSRD